jgi:hypothetical protein
MNYPRVLRWGLPILAVLLAFSCVRSLQPLYEDEDLVFEPRLLGTWTDGDGKDDWTFARGVGNEYILTCLTGEDEVKAKFRARLGKLGGAFFLDLFPEKGGAPMPKNDLLTMHLIPAHTFWRVRFDGGLHLDPFNADWLKEGIREGRLKIPHVETPDEIILTASMPDLQAFLAGLASDNEAFPPSDEALRKR